mgnify:CR=1 FL=1
MSRPRQKAAKAGPAKQPKRRKNPWALKKLEEAIIALEEERAAGADLSDEAINGVKSGLMGPLAGVGDSLIQGLVTPLLLSLGIGLAQQGERVRANPLTAPRRP